MLTLGVKVLTLPFSIKAARFSHAMRRLAPTVRTIQTVYADDALAMNQAMLRLYVENRLSPWGGYGQPHEERIERKVGNERRVIGAVPVPRDRQIRVAIPAGGHVQDRDARRIARVSADRRRGGNHRGRPERDDRDQRAGEKERDKHGARG